MSSSSATATAVRAFTASTRRMTTSATAVTHKNPIAVIGAGCIGLATAHALAKIKDTHLGGRDIYVLEAAADFGHGVSSRNSGVLHAGIYYPFESNKRKYCIQGHRMIKEFCDTYNVPYKLCGKLIVEDSSSADST